MTDLSAYGAWMAPRAALSHFIPATIHITTWIQKAYKKALKDGYLNVLQSRPPELFHLEHSGTSQGSVIVI